MKKLLAMLMALMMVLSIMTVAVFAEQGDTEEDPAEGDNMTVTEEEPAASAPAEESNPKTGLVLAALPVVISAAAVVVSKKH